MSNPRHLIVDGSNILHAWTDLRRLLAHYQTGARSQLLDRLIPVHDAGDVRLTVVFDGRGKELVLERPFAHATFSVVYTPSSLTADDVIEQMVANSAMPADCIVATDDNAERETVAALGATILRSEDLAAWADHAQAHQALSIEHLRSANKRAWKQS